MPRIARIVAVGYPHHITQRGNYKQPIFEDSNDFRQYLEWLKEYSKHYSLKIWAYCLMKNHVHFICVPLKEDSLSSTFSTLHMRYSQYFNQKNKVTGHLWQGRFYSCVLDERHLCAGVKYVENNPVRAKIVKNAEEYIWSSTRGHINRNSDPILSQDCHLVEEIKDWREYLKAEDASELIKEIKKGTMTGRPCGNKGFIKQMENLIGRCLEVLPMGRPRKIL